MTRVLLTTFCLLPDGEPGGQLLDDALAARGVDAAWVCWDDDSVRWQDADLVAVRATWDYHRRCADFLDWAATVEKQTALLNGADVFTWNADKAYLTGLADRVPTVPSLLVGDSDLRGGLRAALDRWGSVVIKARTGASGVGVVVAEATDDHRLSGLTAGPWIAQPLVESVRTAGETSVFVLGGRPVSQVDKLPAAGEIRVHEEYGGESRAVPLAERPAAVALRAVEAAESLLGRTLDYARVDLMELDGDLVVGELELIEPGLYLDVHPGNAEAFADLVVTRLSR
ncbi:ATP-grasp domain-containing protein [Nocardioides sp. MAHUQ-72]|uniref:ATP-grasp domain-containing protein n=1 Tax=unclassified Nocardioides TaxID=2615069 RepID=UPI0036123626